ncbi:hypothetical protein vBAspATola_03 [Aeromonas phage vB_AspA_Tola]|nr:hypothetical protein vBAspATola_03 [Aeromonas phage vB_AspA_Tola]
MLLSTSYQHRGVYMGWIILVVVVLSAACTIGMLAIAVVWLVWLGLTGKLVSPYHNQHLVMVHLLKQMEDK